MKKEFKYRLIMLGARLEKMSDCKTIRAVVEVELGKSGTDILNIHYFDNKHSKGVKAAQKWVRKRYGVEPVLTWIK